ncbi:MAG: ornithine cyclodeaminase family protein, partial [Akkermansiaceae bacterium]
DDIHCNLSSLLDGSKPGRESAGERTYFNAVGLSYADVGIAHAMYLRAKEAGKGSELTLQQEMIFEHANLKDWVRI